MKNTHEEKLVLSLFGQMLEAASCEICEGLSLAVLYEEGDCPHCCDQRTKLVIL